MKQEELEKNYELSLIKELNSAKISSEEHAAIMVDTIDTVLIELDKETADLQNVRTKLFKLIDDLQYQDINRQKIERVIHHLIESGNISDEILEKENIASAPLANHIDEADGDVISEEELAKLIANGGN
ncbi:MAG TPA: hypothetical protein ENK66_02420 [Arcobacter sp.]|jgi:Asp-tRNA(Asn)/Glu-tRNA(Gln) amidotransferase B subunit|nr:hypothetical protein [Arcobacter sp.]